jgi:hypothetical protein
MTLAIVVVVSAQHTNIWQRREGDGNDMEKPIIISTQPAIVYFDVRRKVCRKKEQKKLLLM